VAAPTAKKGGSGLSKKVLGMPLWLLAILGLVAGYLLYRYAAGSLGGSSNVAQVNSGATSTSSPTTSPDTSTGSVPTAGSPDDTGQTTSDLLTALGGQQSNLLSAFEAANQDVVGLAQSQITAAQQQGLSPSTITETQPTVAPQPGGSGASIIQYVSPTAVSPTTTAKPQTSSIARYYTYKTQVPLAAGQTVHFTPGRGYYAAAA
jgi:hypothetical protein